MASSLPLDNGQFSRLVGLAYDAGLEPGGWEAFGEAASKSLDARLALVLFFDHGQPERSFMAGGGDIYADFMPRFEAQWHPDAGGDQQDPLWNTVRDSQPGTVRRNLDVQTAEQVRSAGIYRHLGAPWKLDHLMIGVVTNSIGVSAYFSLARSADSDGFTAADKRLVRDSLLTHLRRSLGLNRTLDQSQQLGAVLSAVTDMSPYGILVFDRHGRTVAVNARAEQIFRGPNGLSLRDGSLRCPDPDTQARLDWSMGVVTAVAEGAGFAPPPPVQVVLPGGRHLELVFSPLRMDRSQTDPMPQGCCMVIIHEHRSAARKNATVSSAISTIYGLTPAEVRLCEALFRGLSLPEAAQSLSISRNTAKTHLSRVFDKTGVRSQIALLRLLAFGPGATRPSEEAGNPG